MTSLSAPPALPTLAAQAVAELGRGEALVFDDVLGTAASRAIARELTRESSDLTPAGIGRDALHAPGIRGDRTRWVERTESAAALPLFALFDHLGRELREKAWLGTGEHEVQLALYPPDGARYRRHRDALAAGGRRRATAVYYLNAGWRPGDGGELRLFAAPSGERDVAPVLDRLVLFLSEKVEHAVLPCRAPRWAATAWYLGPAAVPPPTVPTA